MLYRHASSNSFSNSNHQWWSFSSLLLLLVLLFTTTTTATAVVSSTSTTIHNKNNNDNDAPIITMPLVPHHVQKARRRLEYGDGNINNNMNDTKKQKEQQEIRRSHYGRRIQEANADEKNFHPEQIAELYQGYGTHYVDLWCGTPPQRQTVIVDTGSGVTAFPCSGCGSDCGVPKYHASPLFVESDSSTFTKLNCAQCLRGACRKYGDEECHIGMSYQEGSSWSAYEAVDTCYVGGPHVKSAADDGGIDAMDPFHAPAFAFDMKFGCQTHLTGLFITQLADGIMGMDNAEAAYWRQMYDRKVIKRRAFSLCFSRHDSVDRGGTESGAMTLGGTDRRLHKSPMVYSSVGGTSGFYAITLRNIYLRKASGGTSAQTSNPDVQPVPLGMDINTVIRSQVIVDSGTTDTYFTRALAPYFNKVWKDMTGTDYGNKKMQLTDEQLDAMPTIIFQLKGDGAGMNTGILDAAKNSGQSSVVGLANLVDPQNPHDILIAMPSRHYMEFDDEDNTWTARFYVDESGSGGVLGANMMMGHDLLFDIENNRIGWAEADCDYTALIQQYSTAWSDGSSQLPPPGGDEEDHTYPEESGGGDDDGDDDDGDATVDDDMDMEGNDDLTPEETGDDGFDESRIDSQEGLPKTKDEPTLPDSQFCSSLTCQGGVIAIVLVVVIVVAVRLLKSTSGGASYEVADSELELKSGSIPAASSDDDEFGTSSSYNGSGIKYRDRPANGDNGLPDMS